MKLFLSFIFFTAISLYAETFVAILETSSQVISYDEKSFITDKLRSEARNALPYDGFTIMTRENIIQMLPPGKTIEECEGNCLVETGKNIAADYVAQARVANMGTKFSVTVEIYSTASNDLLKSISDRADDVDGVGDLISAHSKELFEPLLTKYMEQQKFDLDDDQALANYAAEKASSKKTHLPIWAKAIPYALGFAAICLGLYENTVVDDEYDTYHNTNYVGNRTAADKQIRKVDDAKTMRNIFYGLGVGLMAVGLTFTIMF